MDLDTLVARYPVIYHMAEKDTWRSIKVKGLLSTSAVLDYFKLTGTARAALERHHRPEKVAVGTGRSKIILRDQKPMTPARLQMGLRDGLTPTQWYKLLNNKVFMWAREERLHGLLKARAYRGLEHDVLTIDTESLLRTHERSIWLCPMNSGNTFPVPHQRGKDTFLRIANYPTKANGKPQKEVVEIVMDYSIPDIAAHVVAVQRMRGDKVIRRLPL